MNPRSARRFALLSTALFSAAGCASAVDDPTPPPDARAPAAPPAGDAATGSSSTHARILSPGGSTSPEAKQLFEVGGEILGAFTGVLGALDTVKSLASLLGMGDSPTVETQIFQQLQIMNQKLDALLDEVGGVSFQIAYSQISPPLNSLRAEAEDARATVRATSAPYVPTIPGLVTLSKAQVYTVLDDSVYWRTYATRLTDGEWKAAIGEPAVEVRDFRTWDYRVGLPAALAAIAYRLVILGSIDPGFATNPVYAAELTLYRDTLQGILSKIEGGILCNYGVSAKVKARSSTTSFCSYTGGFGPSVGACNFDVTYTLNAFCADPFTGAYTKLSATAPLSSDPTWDESTPCVSFGYGPPTASCFDRDMGVNQHDVLASSWNYSAFGAYSVDLYNRFWAVAPTHPAFADLIANGLDDARAQLKLQLGLFGVRRAIDSLSMLVTHDKGPLYGGRNVSGYYNRCLSAAGDVASVGAGAVIAECDRASAARAEVFTYDTITGQIHNTASGTCLDVQNGSSRLMTPVWFWGCWPSVTDPRSNAQRWSYDPVSHRLRNALGRTLDVRWGDSTPGTPVWTYDENPTAAQQWGYKPYWWISL